MRHNDDLHRALLCHRIALEPPSSIAATARIAREGSLDREVPPDRRWLPHGHTTRIPTKQWPCITGRPEPLGIDDGNTPADEPRRSSAHIIDATQRKPREPLSLRCVFCVMRWRLRCEPSRMLVALEADSVPIVSVGHQSAIANANTSARIELPRYFCASSMVTHSAPSCSIDNLCLTHALHCITWNTRCIR